jgi:hypothetical protein
VSIEEINFGKNNTLEKVHFLDIRSILRRVQTSQLRDADVVPGPDPDVQVVVEGQEERNHKHENKIRNGTRKTRICF